ncbi:hypothetical protein FHK02_390 [Spirosoma sp. LMG 31448]|nr:hypothetical protein [Spirosoma utsteinense]
MIRSVLIASVFSLYASFCLAQSDSTRSSRLSPQPAVQIPGIDTPMSGPGTLLQSSPNPNMEPVPQRKGKKRRRTSPPSDPRAFGVSIPLEGAKKDTLNR